LFVVLQQGYFIFWSVHFAWKRMYTESFYKIP
jgi:hypothetical protein